MWADEIKLYDKPPSAEEMSRDLFPEHHVDEVPIDVKTRSISFGTKKAAKSAQKAERAGIGLPIQFAYNSAEILSESNSYLEQLGILLKTEKMTSFKLLIEGHTDASGSEGHNKLLSESRAEAVKNYLISKYDVNPYKLIITGIGENRPLRHKDPNDPLNRRVEFYRAD
jgi:outer membrane protein OmpA-like peptidoglycan-associated protein